MYQYKNVKKGIIKTVFALLCSIQISFSAWSQKVIIKNLTGEDISIISFVQKDSLIRNIDSLVLNNKLDKPLLNGQSTSLELKKQTYNIHAFSSANTYEGNIYFVPLWNPKNKVLELNKKFIESQLGENSIVAMNNYESPRVMIKIINESGLSLYKIYYKSISNPDFEANSIIQSWNPIFKNETRKVFFFPSLKIKKGQNGKETYEGLLDLKVIGVTEKGELKEFLIPNFDCVNKEDIVVK